MMTLDTGLRGFYHRLPEIDSLLEDIEHEHKIGIDAGWHSTIHRYMDLPGFEGFVVRWTGVVDEAPEYGVHAKFCDSDHLILAKLAL